MIFSQMINKTKIASSVKSKIQIYVKKNRVKNITVFTVIQFFMKSVF